MYLCLCNALSEAQVEQAVRDGARRPRDIYARCDCRAQCGRCVRTILDAVRSGAVPRQPILASQEA